jgi:hypothetical protein
MGVMLTASIYPLSYNCCLFDDLNRLFLQHIGCANITLKHAQSCGVRQLLVSFAYPKKKMSIKVWPTY